MSEILARIRVKEEHGIRRFLYPLIAELRLPTDIYPSQSHRIALINADGSPVPSQVTLASGRMDEPQRLDFAVSLAPLAATELQVVLAAGAQIVDDPMTFGVLEGHHGICSVQRRFALELDWDGAISDVIYDGVPHLRGPSSVMRNCGVLEHADYQDLNGEELIAAWMQAEGRYADGCAAKTRVELTACKSWATVTHTLEQPKAGDEIKFTLPLKIIAESLVADFGIGGGIYGKLNSDNAQEIVWLTKFDGDMAHWSLATAGRTDFAGESTLEQFRSQAWFHLIDGRKALAAAITAIPPKCEEMRVATNTVGNVEIAFRLGEIAGSAEVGVCYHFLNDIPAIAAATNPQSILLPPTVEVLPF